MKISPRLMGAIRSPLLWLVLSATILVLFPFDWLSEVWPAYGSLFDRVFVSEREHAIGHTMVFLIAGLLVLCSIPQLRRRPLLYTLIMMLGAVGEELFQALSKWQMPDIGDGRDIGFDVLGFVLAYLFAWIWCRLKNAQKGEKEREKQVFETQKDLLPADKGGTMPRSSSLRFTSLLGLLGSILQIVACFLPFAIWRDGLNQTTTQVDSLWTDFLFPLAVLIPLCTALAGLLRKRLRLLLGPGLVLALLGWASVVPFALLNFIFNGWCAPEAMSAADCTLVFAGPGLWLTLCGFPLSLVCVIAYTVFYGQEHHRFPPRRNEKQMQRNLARSGYRSLTTDKE